MVSLCANPTILAAGYRFEELLLQGPQSIVLRARDLQTQKAVVIKSLPGQSTLTGKDRVWAQSRLKREASLLATLEHPHIPTLRIDNTEHAHDPHLVMDVVDGEPLSTWLHYLGRFSVDLAIEIGLQVCEIEEYLQTQSVLHLDIKPSNVLWNPDPDGGKGQVFLVDFGIARCVRSPLRKSHNAAGSIHGGRRCLDKWGTMGYAPPEQYRGERLTRSADVYSLGATLYHILGGVAPTSFQFHLKRLQQVGVPSLLVGIIARMLQPQAPLRPSLREVRRVLQVCSPTESKEK